MKNDMKEVVLVTPWAGHTKGQKIQVDALRAHKLIEDELAMLPIDYKKVQQEEKADAEG